MNIKIFYTDSNYTTKTKAHNNTCSHFTNNHKIHVQLSYDVAVFHWIVPCDNCLQLMKTFLKPFFIAIANKATYVKLLICLSQQLFPDVNWRLCFKS